jgi:hypothetical protein
MKRISDLLLVVCFSLAIIGCSSNESEPAAPATQAESSEAAATAEGSRTETEDAGGSAVENDGAETTE